MKRWPPPFRTTPPGFFRRTPHGYFDVTAITTALRQAGFATVESGKVTLPCRAPSAQHVATALCQGTPLRPEIEQRDAGRLSEVTERAAHALTEAFGKGPVETTMHAIIFEAA